MCDTIVALGNATADGAVLFGKNSDRDPREAQEIVRIPAADHAPGTVVRCTYVDVPQVEHTYEVLLSRPFWLWGAEMGANEHGVAIGNEAVFTKVPYEKKPGLIGMDFLRLALERSRTAAEARAVIVGLLERHGQGGNCGYPGKLFYHNSFLIADPREAWVLETAGPHWAAERVRDVRTISNRITIGGRWDLASTELVTHAVKRRWCRGRDDFDFGRCYSDFLFTRFSDARRRQCRTAEFLESRKGRLTIADLMIALRAGPRPHRRRRLRPRRVRPHPPQPDHRLDGVAFGGRRADAFPHRHVGPLYIDIQAGLARSGTAGPRHRADRDIRRSRALLAARGAPQGDLAQLLCEPASLCGRP
jgi:secernin